VTGYELRARLVEQQRELEQAEQAAGAAQLDGSGAKTTAKRLQDARTRVALTEAALAEHDRRERERAERQAEAEVAGRREQSYRWAADYFRAVAVVLNRMQQLHEAERELQTLEIGGRLYDRRLNRDRLDDRGAGGFDMSLVGEIPFGHRGQWPARTVADVQSIRTERARLADEGRGEPLTEEQCIGWAEQADRLAEAEAGS
jgi:hypothetical protein